MAVADKSPYVGPATSRGTQVPDLGGRHLASAVLDTTELRWFVEGRLPPEIRTWFTCDGTTGIVEGRCDSYRMDGRPDQGLKRRFRETLELKVRRSVGERLVLDSGIAGRLEEWRRWSPAEGVVDTAGHMPWVDVHKVVVKRRFTIDGEEVALSTDTRAVTGTGCDVEVTAVAVRDMYAWTFAFAAFGPATSHRDALVNSWHALAAVTPRPEQFGPFVEASSGYPAWLAVRMRATVTRRLVAPRADH